MLQQNYVLVTIRSPPWGKPTLPGSPAGCQLPGQPGFSSIPFTTATTWLDSNPFFPLHKFTVLQSYLSIHLLPACLGQRTAFHPLKNQSSPLIWKAPLSSSSPLLLDCGLLGQAPGRSLQSLLWLFLFSLHGSPLLPHTINTCLLLLFIWFLSFKLTVEFFWCHPNLISDIKTIHDFASCFSQDILWD